MKRYFIVTRVTLIINFIHIVISTGLLKGSVTAERPRTLRRLRNVYGPSACGMGTGGDGGGGERLEDGEVSFRLSDRDRERDEKSLSIMSPFDEQEEWAKISEIMASIGTGLVRESVFVTELEKEFQTRLGIYIYICIRYRKEVVFYFFLRNNLVLIYRGF